MQSAPSNEPTVAQTTSAKPSERAVEILAKACDDAARAQSVEDFSLVVQQCRHVLAIDRAAAVVNYAEELGAWALNKRGELRADAGETADALTDFNEALRMDGTRWRARHNRGVLMAQSGKYEDAFEDFNDVIEQSPKFAKAYSNRASLYVQAGEFDAAMSDYRRAISLDPDLAVAHKGRGRVCHMLGKMDDALRHLDAAMLLAPEDAHVASCRADLLVDTGRYGQAVEGYRQAIALDAELATAYRNLAWLEATCPNERYRDGEAAVGHAKQALALTGKTDGVSLDTLAAAHAAAGDFDSAVSFARQAMATASADDTPAYAQRLQLYESRQPFVSSPIAPVEQTAYQY
ncbi:MAG: tetratricopeptide repeat protein [Planctomycetota bacterium]